MSNLLNAYFSRIFKSRWFVFVLVFSVGFALVSVLVANGAGGTLGNLPTLPLTVIPMVIAAFVGLLIAPEHTNGVMRNKIIIGHNRNDIYISYFIVLSAVALICLAAYEIVIFTVGTALLDIVDVSAKATVVSLLLMMLLFITSKAISLLICMIVPNSKSIALVILLQYALMFISGADEIFGDNKVIKIISCFIPQGQSSSLSVYSMPDKLWTIALNTVLLCVTVTLLGIYSFRKSDIK